MTDGPVELPPDEPPKSGVWVDSEEFFLEPTEEEVAEGNFMGKTINTWDDEDNGL